MATLDSSIPSLDSVIGGERVALDGPPIEIIDPSTEEVLGTTPDVGAEGVDRAVASARAGFEVWSKLTYRERAERLMAFADAWQSQRDEFGRLEALDVGKPLEAAKPEVDSSSDRIRFFAMGARTMSVPNSGNYRDRLVSLARRSPVGVVGCITPWNAPMGLLAWKIGPALAAGNSVVVKPAEETPITTLLLAEIAAEFLPPGVFNVITGNGPTAGDALVRHPDVPMISMTGETGTGKAIYAAAAPQMKKLHLELGGPSAILVFDDADLERFEAALPFGTFRNSGQDCHALSRIFAQEGVKDRVVEACVRVSEAQRLGECFDPDTVMGPLVSSRQRERVAGIVDEAAAHSHIDVVTGGSTPDRRGFFYPATVLDGVRADDSIKQTEIFGPVITVTSFAEEAEAISWGNGGNFGLSAGVWTSSLDRGLRVSDALEVGTIWVNDHSKTVTEMPFGGWKHSGVGRELTSAVIEEHTEFKHIAIDVPDA
jgi:acyl-CoA reductase-like NAD-dependent aldehyde dehydrogenase